MARRAPLERFWLYVTRGSVDECWEWRGCRQRGYGIFGVGVKTLRAYRWLYELERGPIPEGRQLDHLCRNRACVNPAHLEPVTRKQNILRGECPSAVNARKTHCVNGHHLSGANVKMKRQSNKRGGYFRRCRLCSRNETRKRRAAAVATI
jgi:hypothetical protein